MAWLFSKALLDALNSSPGLAEGYSPVSFSDGEQSALWNPTPTARPSWYNDKTTATSSLSQSGLRFRILNRGAGIVTSLQRASHAPTSHPPDLEGGSKGKGAVCSDTWSALPWAYDRNLPGSGWKIVPCLWEEGCPESSVRLTRQGMMRSGQCWERITPLERHIKEIGYGSWQKGETALLPTPTSRDRKGRSGPGRLERNGPALADAVHYLPTPCASDNRDRGHMNHPSIKRRVEIGKQVMLSMAVNDGTTGGYLSPRFVEWMLGWPMNWTCMESLPLDTMAAWRNAFNIDNHNLPPSATAKSRWSQHKHG
jgi:hypothetical protein